MKRLFFGVIVLLFLFTVWMVIGQSNQKIKVTAQYLQGKITTQVKTEDIQNIESTIFRYKTHYLDQYINVGPEVQVYIFPNEKETHVFEVHAELFEGKKDNLEVEVAVKYQDGTEEILGNVTIPGIKKQVYDDFVIKPEFEEGSIFYRTNGLTAVIKQDEYDEEILFYSDPNREFPNISVGFQKDHSLYPLSVYEVIPETEALNRNYEGFAPVDFTNISEGHKSYIVIEHGMFDLWWDGLYPYDNEGNEVIYEAREEDSGIVLARDNETLEISKASHEKWTKMVNKIPNIKFLITSFNK